MSSGVVRVNYTNRVRHVSSALAREHPSRRCRMNAAASEVRLGVAIMKEKHSPARSPIVGDTAQTTTVAVNEPDMIYLSAVQNPYYAPAVGVAGELRVDAWTYRFTPGGDLLDGELAKLDITFDVRRRTGCKVEHEQNAPLSVRPRRHKPSTYPARRAAGDPAQKYAERGRHLA
jgi:hypothetical protein